LIEPAENFTGAVIIGFSKNGLFSLIQERLKINISICQTAGLDLQIEKQISAAYQAMLKMLDIHKEWEKPGRYVIEPVKPLLYNFTLIIVDNNQSYTDLLDQIGAWNET